MSPGDIQGTVIVGLISFLNSSSVSSLPAYNQYQSWLRHVVAEHTLNGWLSWSVELRLSVGEVGPLCTCACFSRSMLSLGRESEEDIVEFCLGWYCSGTWLERGDGTCTLLSVYVRLTDSQSQVIRLTPFSRAVHPIGGTDNSEECRSYAGSKLVSLNHFFPSHSYT